MVSRLLIIIPCFNEETTLPQLLEKLKNTAVPEGYEYVPVVVNDCSSDRTAAVAKQHNVRVLNLVNNLGIGGAVQTGIRYALEQGFDLAIQMDGDGQHPPGEIVKHLAAMSRYNADVVIGSRFLTREGFQTSFLRRIGIRYFYGLNRILTGKNIHDSTSGFRLLGKKAIALAARHYPDDYPEPESLVFFSRAGLSIKEIPVVMSPRLGGKSSINSFASLYYFIKVTLSMFFSYIRKL